MSRKHWSDYIIDDKLEEWQRTKSITIATEICETLVAAKILMAAEKKEGDKNVEEAKDNVD